VIDLDGLTAGLFLALTTGQQDLTTGGKGNQSRPLLICGVLVLASAL
jgi:hypothetical protein